MATSSTTRRYGRRCPAYIISERFMTARELYETAAEAGGANPPRLGVPLWVMYVAGSVGDAAALLLRRDSVLSRMSVRLMHIMPRLDHGKAERELGWQPEPIHDSLRRAAEFYRAHRRRRREAA
jgi:dihydroflavonol-4-reductase